MGKLPFQVESKANISKLHASILKGLKIPEHLSHSELQHEESQMFKYLQGHLLLHGV